MPRDIHAPIARVASFLADADIGTTITDLERELVRADLPTAMQASARRGMDQELLISAMRARRDLVGMNDVVHATAIMVSLPVLLEADEVIQRPPALSTKDDRTRRFDLETDRRIAEFRLAVWDGSDGGRQRKLFRDLTHLALHDPEDSRLRQLFVVGGRPINFLQTSRTKMRNLLDRGSRVTKDLVRARVSLDTAVRDFVATHASAVRLVDLCDCVPEVGHTIKVLDDDTVTVDTI